MCVIDMVRFWARAASDRSAIIQSEMVITYRGLADAIESIAERIERLNLDKNDPVALSIANPSYMLATAFALLDGGYDVASVTPPLFPYLRGAGIRNLIYDLQSQVLSGGRNVRFEMSWLPKDGANTPVRHHRKRASEFGDMIFFTSGTTGLPKKITQTRKALQELLKYPFTSASGIYKKILIMPNLSSTFGFNRACEILNAGKTVCFAQTIDTTLSLVESFGIEFIVASAAQALALAELKKKNPAYQLNSLTAVLIGGGKISTERIAEIREIFVAIV